MDYCLGEGIRENQKEDRMNSKGVTLIELLIVVAIIGILSLIAVPAYIGQQKNAARTEAYSNLENLRLLEEQYFAENGCYFRNAGGACAITSISGTDSVKAFLPGFKPGNAADLNFNYSLSVFTPSGAVAGGFTATAAGKTNTRVTGDSFWINHNNDRNF
jgi:prepilin-type N-terminal cleavage/methylation domain-containing protein